MFDESNNVEVLFSVSYNTYELRKFLNVKIPKHKGFVVVAMEREEFEQTMQFNKELDALSYDKYLSTMDMSGFEIEHITDNVTLIKDCQDEYQIQSVLEGLGLILDEKFLTWVEENVVEL